MIQPISLYPVFMDQVFAPTVSGESIAVTVEGGAKDIDVAVSALQVAVELNDQIDVALGGDAEQVDVAVSALQVDVTPGE